MVEYLILGELATFFTVAAIFAAVTAGVAILAHAGKDGDEQRPLDDSAPNFAKRGDPIPRALCRRREVEGRFSSVWGRYAREEQTSQTIEGGKGVSGGSGGGGGGTQTVVYENAVQTLCMAADNVRIHRIFEAGEVVWEAPTADGVGPDPDGKYEIGFGIDGTAVFWFGQQGQTTRVLARKYPNGEPLTVGSGAGVVTVEWRNKRLGQTAVWKSLSYEIEANHSGNALDGSAYFLTPAGKGQAASGVNLAHALHDLLTLPAPAGLGWSTSQIDTASFEALGVVCETEGLAVNILSQGQTFGELIEDLLRVGDVALVEVDGVLSAKAKRPQAENPPTLSDDVLTDRPSPKILLGVQWPNRVIFSHPDRDLDYSDNPVPASDDAAVDFLGHFNDFEISTQVITDHSIATAVADRVLSTTFFGDRSAFSMTSLRGAVLVRPGRLATLPGSGVVRVQKQREDLVNGAGIIEATLDPLSAPSVDAFADSLIRGSKQPVRADRAFSWFEIPKDEDNSAKFSIAVVRIRDHEDVLGANIHASNQSTEFRIVGAQNRAAFGGQLLEAMSDVGGILSSGPLFVARTSDEDALLDLSSDERSWQQGLQLMVVGSGAGVEVCFVERVVPQAETVWAPSTGYNVGDHVVPPSAKATGLRYRCVQAGTSGTSVREWPDRVWKGTFTDNGVVWQPDWLRFRAMNVIRSRFGTLAASHDVGQWVFVIPKTLLSKIDHPVLAVGDEVCVKTQPFINSATLDIAAVTAICRFFTGNGSEFSILVDQDGSPIVTEKGDLIAAG